MTAAEETEPAAATLVVGAHLRMLRLSRNVSLREAAKGIRCSAAKISQMESGHAQHEDEVAALMRYYEVLDWPSVKAVRQLVQARDRHVICDMSPRWLDRLYACEREADAIRLYTTTAIPAILHMAPDAPRALPPGHGKDVTVLLDEAVLMRPCGGLASMAAQLAHLQRVIARGDAQVLVLPVSVGVLAQTGYLAELTLHHQRLLMKESLGAVYSTGAEGEAMSLALDAAFAAAEPAERSAEMLEQARAGFEQQAAEGRPS